MEAFHTPMELLFPHTDAQILPLLVLNDRRGLLRFFANVHDECMNDYFVYLLQCVDRTIYVGVTNDFQRRLCEHQLGLHPDSYTYSRRPVQLLHVAMFNDIYEAIAWEKHVKRWSHSKKAAWAKGDEVSLHVLSKKKFPVRTQRSYASLRRKNISCLRASLRSRLRRELLGMTLRDI